jgi:hypothetical protein
VKTRFREHCVSERTAQIFFDSIAPRSSTETLLEAALDEERGHGLVGSQVEALLGSNASSRAICRRAMLSCKIFGAHFAK